MTRARRVISSWPVRLLITGGLLAAVLSQVDVVELRRGLEQARPSPFLAALVAVLFMRVFAAARMCAVLERHLVELSLVRVFAINLRTAFVSFFLPGHLAGGVVRWQLLTRAGAGRADALTAIGFDRLSDFSALLLTGFLCSLLSRDTATSDLITLLLGLVLAGTLLLQVVVLSEKFFAAAHAIGSRLGLLQWDWSVRAFEKLDVSVRAFRGLPVRSQLRIWGWSLASNVTGLAYYYCLARSADLELGLFELGWVRSAITALGMLPLTLAGLGVREGAMISLLAPYGIAPVVAVTFSLMLFLTGVVVALAGGTFLAYDLLVGGGWQRRSKTPAEPATHA